MENLFSFFFELAVGRGLGSAKKKSEKKCFFCLFSSGFYVFTSERWRGPKEGTKDEASKPAPGLAVILPFFLYEWGVLFFFDLRLSGPIKEFLCFFFDLGKGRTKGGRQGSIFLFYFSIFLQAAEGQQPAAASAAAR